MSKILNPILLSTILLLIVSCEKKEDEIIDTTPKLTDEQKENKSINDWIWDEMDLYYLWNNFLPKKTESISAPGSYFNTLIYSDKDKWSYITEDYKQLLNSFQGIEKAVGYSLALYIKDAGNYDIVAYIEFVYPNTPASRAGLKRGDIIVEINGQTLNRDNYYDLLFRTDNQTIRLAEYIAGMYDNSDQTISVVAEEIQENPVLKDTTYIIEGKTIGYLAYVGFISNFNSSLDSALTRLKNANISDLILDFRYNPGGGLSAANYLCSSIAPASAAANKSRLVNYNWNTDLQAYITSQGWNDNLYVNMIDSTAVNLNLSKVYILTTRGTASASELTIIGLKPYMDVVTIGETTTGKYTASITLPHPDSIWALQPIVLKYSNADGVSDFEDGLTPDFPVNDDFRFQLGDPKDPMVSKAISVITGVDFKSARLMDAKRGYKYLHSAGRHPIINMGVLNLPSNLRIKDGLK